MFDGFSRVLTDLIWFEIDWSWTVGAPYLRLALVFSDLLTNETSWGNTVTIYRNGIKIIEYRKIMQNYANLIFKRHILGQSTTPKRKIPNGFVVWGATIQAALKKSKCGGSAHPSSSHRPPTPAVRVPDWWCWRLRQGHLNTHRGDGQWVAINLICSMFPCQEQAGWMVHSERGAPLLATTCP